MDEKMKEVEDVQEIAKEIFDAMTDEQRKKIAECQTEEEVAEMLKGMEGQLSDNAAGEATGGFAFATLIPYNPAAITGLEELAHEIIIGMMEQSETITGTDQ